MFWEDHIRQLYLQACVEESILLQHKILRTSETPLNMVLESQEHLQKALLLLQEVEGPHNDKAFQEVLYLSYKLKLPKSHKEDITFHMQYRELCIPNAPVSFGIGLRDTGADLYDPRSVDALDTARARISPMVGDASARWFLFTPSDDYYKHYRDYKEVTLPEMMVWLAEQLPIGRYEVMNYQANKVYLFVSNHYGHTQINFDTARSLLNIANRKLDMAREYKRTLAGQQGAENQEGGEKNEPDIPRP